MAATENSGNRSNRKDLCRVCGAVLPADVKSCLICGTSRGKSIPPRSYKPYSATPNEGNSQVLNVADVRKDRRLPRVAAMLLSLLLVVSGLLVGGVEYISYQGLLRKYSTAGALLYSGKEGLKITLPSLEQPLSIAEGYHSDDGLVRASSARDNRHIAYLGESSTGGENALYLLNLINLDESVDAPREGIQVTEDAVTGFRFFPGKDWLAYLTDQGELYLCDYSSFLSFLTKSRLHLYRLDEGVKGIAATSDGKLLYYKGASAGLDTLEGNPLDGYGSGVDLYVLRAEEAIAGKVSPALVDEGVYTLLDYTEELDSFCYIKQRQGGKRSRYDVYLTAVEYADEGASSANVGNKQIAEGVWRVVDADAATGDLLYLSPEMEALTYEDLLEDDKAFSDRLMADPLEGTGEETTLEDAEWVEAEEQGTETEELPATSIAWVDGDRQDATVRQYEEKLLRDMFRPKFQDALASYQRVRDVSFRLLYYSGENGERKQLSQGIFKLGEEPPLIQASLEEDYVLYSSRDILSMRRPKLSDFSMPQLDEFVSEPIDMAAFLSTYLRDSLILSAPRAGTTQRVFTESGSRSLGGFFIPPNGEDLFFYSYPDYGSPAGILYQSSIAGGQVGNVVYIDEDVGRVIGVAGAPNTGVIYQTLSRDDPPERSLYNRTPEGIVEIAYDTAPGKLAALVGARRNTLLFYRDYDEAAGAGDLYLYVEEEQLIAERVKGYFFRDDGSLFVAQLESDGQLRLNSYDSTGLHLIEEDVEGYHYFPMFVS